MSDQSLQQLLVTNFGLLPSGYTGSQGAIGYTGSAGTTGSGGGPKITNIQVTNSSYTVLDDTAVDIAGGYVKITGTGFESGCMLMINNVPATSTTFVSSTEVRAQLPSTAAGTYVVYLVNTDGGVAIRINGVTFSTTPTWSTASALAGAGDGTAVSIQLAATGASTYSLAAGSTLPGTLTVSSSGLISGVLPTLMSETTYSFTVLATDAELQDSPRTFSITITAGDQSFPATTLLLPGSVDTFVKDASTNNFSVTIVGDTKPTVFNPYLTGWSNFFDGSGDCLTTPNNAAFALGTGDFTLECWVNATSTPSDVGIFESRTDGISTTENGFTLTAFSSSVIRIYTNGILISSSGTSYVNTWCHVAVVRASGVWTLYVNGVSQGTSSAVRNMTNTDAVIGAGRYNSNSTPSAFFPGYISNFRVVKGTAVYTANFTPSTQPLTAVAGTSLLTCADNRFIDDSTNNFAVTVSGDVKVQSFSPFTEPATTRGSAYFAGGTSYITAPVTASAGDLTIECWIYPTAYTSPRAFVFTSGGNDATAWAISYGTNSIVSAWIGSYGGPSVASTNTVPLNTWGHIAIVKTAGTVYMYVNGIRSTGVSQAGTFGSATNVHIATYNGGINSQSFAGYVSNFRYVDGTALYTGATVTPPASPLTAVAGTRLLTLQTNVPVSNNTFLDSSSNNLLITRNGNATQGSFSPFSPSGWSNYFDGGTNRLTTAGSAIFNLSGINFTLECWIYMTAAPSVLNRLITIGPNNVQSSFTLAISPSRQVDFSAPFSSGGGTGQSAALALNTWHHLAFVLSGSTGTMYINGIQSAQTTGWNITSSNSNYFYVGYDATATVDGKFTGYVSNVRLVKGTAVYTGAFTPPAQPLTTVAGTAILTCADNRIVDDSANNFTITRAGDVRVTNFSPFKAVVQTPTTYSAYFDGSGDSLEIPDSASLEVGSTDFTIEAWVYIIASVSGSAVISKGGASSPYLIYQGGTGELSFYASKGAGWAIADLRIASTPALATWHHIAVSRSGTTFRTFFNGNLANTIELSGELFNNSSPVSIGTYTGSFNGYISNLRIVKGTAVYTANFTPSTQPLTAIANTSLLTCQSATFVDNSTNRFAITAVGNSQSSMVNPFGSTFANSTGYTAAEYGGSMSFDGTGDYLELPSDASLALPGDFTMEAWVYLVAGALTGFVSTYRNNTQSGAVIGINGSNQILFRLGNDNSGFQVTDPVVLPIGSWHHIAGVRSGSTMTLYKNGISVGSIGGVNISCDNTIAVINSYYSTMAGYHGNCYISGARILKGQALYNSNFVPPAAPVAPVQNTVLLLNGTAAAITDATTKTVLETVGDAKISTAVSKWGGSSMRFDGTGDYLVSPASLNNSLGTGNFTVECWFNRSAATSGGCIVGAWSGTVATSAWIMTQGTTNSGDLRFGVCDGTTATFFEPTTVVIQDNTWIHLAVTRSSGTIYMFANGTLLTSVANTTNISPSAALGIGAVTNNTFASTGYIQDVRVTRGVARYTANFTPPASAFQTR